MEVLYFYNYLLDTTRGRDSLLVQIQNCKAKKMEADGGEGGARKEETPAEGNKSIFPLFSATAITSVSFTVPEDHQWLRNTSFSGDVPAIPPLPSSTTDIFKSAITSSDEERSAEEGERKSYSLLASSDEDDGVRHGKRKERRVRRKKKRRRKDGDRQEEVEKLRRSGVRAWDGSDTKPEKEYYFDASGDRDNLAFGSIYRMDVARYTHHATTDSSGQILYNLNGRNSRDLLMEVDGDVLDGKLRSGGRYWSARYSMLERHKGFKHVKVVRKKNLAFLGEFVPVNVEDRSSPLGKDEDEESWEDEVIQKTREFNKMSREFPHDEKVWTAFADFQDKVASMQPQKAARLQTLEKKISILEKAVELNPDSEELLLYLLKSYERRDSSEILSRRWEKVLMQHFDSCRLWKEYLLVGQGDFSRFRVSDMRRRYAQAIQALSSACSRLHRQGTKSEKNDPSVIQLELGLVDVFLSLCRFEWQSGFQELATGLFQAEIEYSLFCPTLDLSIQSKQRLFEHFWSSNAPRIGENRCMGWSAWIEEEERRNCTIKEDSVPEIEVGGWTGWFEPLSKTEETKHEKHDDNMVGSGDVVEDIELEGAEEEDDVESLLKKLGINVSVEPQNEVKDTLTWNRWSKEESTRDSKQWMPVRESFDAEGSEQLSRAILFEDVRDYLFSLNSNEGRFCLISRLVDFYGGKISPWTCTNSSSWTENNISLDTLPGFIIEFLGCDSELRNGNNSYSRNLSSGSHVNGSDDIERDDAKFLRSLIDESNELERPDTNKFLRNSLLLCLNVFPRNYILEEALLVAEELSVSVVSSTTSSSIPSQALAKHLLKNDRQDLLLSGLYARREAAYGNIDRARKVFDMTLSSIDSLPSDLRGNRPLLYLWYAEMEVENSAADQTSMHAIHILSYLGCGEEYRPYNGQISSPQLLKAHNGFKEQIKHLGSAWAHGCITDKSTALVCAASLFETLMTRWSTSIEIIEGAFSMLLPERRAQSSELECLCVYCIKLLQTHTKEIDLSILWTKLLQYLHTYSSNPKILSSVIEVGSVYTVPQKIRRVFDEHSHRKPSVVILLFALSYELGRSCSQHRIRRLFERVLADDKLQRSAILWRCYLAFEVDFTCNYPAAKRVYFRAIHSCPWSKKLWLDGFRKLSSILTASELSDLHEVMHEKELHLRTDIYEILLQDEFSPET